MADKLRGAQRWQQHMQQEPQSTKQIVIGVNPPRAVRNDLDWMMPVDLVPPERCDARGLG